MTAITISTIGAFFKLAIGHQCVFINASLDLCVQPWARSTGFKDVVRSRLAHDENSLVIGDLISVELSACGDSDGGLALLREADHALSRNFGELLLAYDCRDKWVNSPDAMNKERIGNQRSIDWHYEHRSRVFNQQGQIGA